MVVAGRKHRVWLGSTPVVDLAECLRVVLRERDRVGMKRELG
jgi:hypothetical protein